MNNQLLEIHPIYPFVQIGPTEAFFRQSDIDSPDTVLEPGEWYIRIAGELHHVFYGSRDNALKNVERAIYSGVNDYKTAQTQLRIALDNNDIKLALVISEGIGRAKGEAEATAAFKESVRKSQEHLARWTK